MKYRKDVKIGLHIMDDMVSYQGMLTVSKLFDTPTFDLDTVEIYYYRRTKR